MAEEKSIEGWQCPATEVLRPEIPAPASAPSHAFGSSALEAEPQAVVPPYSVFSTRSKRYVTYLLGYLCLISSLSATIYFPLIPFLAAQYSASIQAINLTITLYVVIQGIAPSFWSSTSDTLGRRPVFLATFIVFTAASVGICFAGRSFIALAFLRALQSIGGSAILSIAYGVISDLVTHSERGSMLGPMMASANLGPCLGPVIGGSVAYASGDFLWCFRTLAIVGGSAVMLVGWTFPETNRRVVGNGSVRAKGVWQTWANLPVSYSRRSAQLDSRTLPTACAADDHVEKATETPSAMRNPVSSPREDNQDNRPSEPVGRGKFSIPNPFVSLRLIFYCDTFLVLFLAASPYAVWYLIQTAIPTIYGGNGYNFSDLAVGLAYLPGGLGVIVGGFLAGRLLDWNFRVVAIRAGVVVNKHAEQDMVNFPIEQARSRGSLVILLVSLCALVGFGWAVEYKVHPAVPLILQFYLGVKCTVLHQAYSALLVDIFPEKPSTAAASNNIVRCGLSAAAVAAMQPWVNVLQTGWFFTMVGLLDAGLCGLAVVPLRQFGKRWRDKRRN